MATQERKLLQVSLDGMEINLFKLNYLIYDILVQCSQP